MINLTTQQIELKNKLNPVIDIASKMLLCGILKKNVLRYFENKGFSTNSAQNILDMGIVRAENLSHYKFN